MSFEIINPSTTKELLSTVKKFQKKNFRFGAGCTDLLLELKKNPEEDLTIINLAQVKDVQLTGIKKNSTGLRIGARVTAHDIVVNEEIKKSYPVLHEAALNLASTQIRQVATVGGNICTGSPSGDIACALVALDADCEILGTTGKTRTIPITDFFTGVRKTVLKKNEVLYGIYIHAKKKNTKNIYSHFIKIGTRRSMECSVVSLAYHIQTDERKKIIHAGIAIGASAPTIRLTESACSFLTGKNLFKISEADKREFAEKILSYASPISDLRASAWYRKEVLFNISQSIFENLSADEK
ncbi:MAG TPA: FAD binding domain-containing protein [Bacteroidia bacterium]|nr:FAD binding domain-containing protein [Bacteroidia bacterium]